VIEQPFAVTICKGSYWPNMRVFRDWLFAMVAEETAC
jgi:LysR family transcriptional regulator of beta-lactamase